MRQFSFKKISSPFQCRFNFSISIQRYHDIVPLNLGQNIYCNLKKYKFEFSPEGTLRQFRQKIQTQYPDIQKLNIYEPYTLAEFTENTPIKEIYSTDFIIKLNNEAFYKIISDIDIKIFRNFDLTNKMIANEINQSFHLLSGLGSSIFFQINFIIIFFSRKSKFYHSFAFC